MSTATAIALMSPATAEPARAGTDARGESNDFDRHLDVAESGPSIAAARAGTRPRPTTTPGSAPSDDAGAAKPAAPDTPVLDETDPTVAAELVAMSAPGVVIVIPPPIADPLAQAAAPLIGGDVTLAVGDAAGNAAAVVNAAVLAAADLASASTAATAAAAALSDARATATRDQAGLDPLAEALTGVTAPASETAPTVAAATLAMLAPATGTDPVDTAPATVDPTSAAAAAAAGTSAPPIATVRPRDSRFERETSPDVLAEGVIPPATTAADATATATARSGDAVPALGPISGDRGPARIEAPAAPPVPPGESARVANAMDRVAGQVSRAILTRGADGERMLVLRLTPPELGTVRIEVVERAGVMTARIHAEDDAVRSALERSLPQLRQDLRANDAPVRDVSLADAWNGFANRQGRNDGSAASPMPAASTPAPRLARRGRTDPRDPFPHLVQPGTKPCNAPSPAVSPECSTTSSCWT